MVKLADKIELHGTVYVQEKHYTAAIEAVRALLETVPGGTAVDNAWQVISKSQGLSS